MATVANSDREPERRILTMVEIDVQDSTPLSGRLDPEDFSSMISSFHKMAGEVIEAGGGHVLKLMGDGVISYFGYPVAHEDDARRAISSALEIAARTVANGQLSIRAGIHTGLVLVQDSSSGSTTHADDVFGQAPAVTARLQHEAPPNGVVVSEATYRLVRGQFEMEALGVRSLKGVIAPVAVYRVLGTAQPESADGVKTPFVGRVAELLELERAWSAAAIGRSQIVVISGEPGIGKSRLVSEFFSARNNSLTLIECREADTDQQYAPVREWLRARLNRHGLSLEEAFQREALRLAPPDGGPAVRVVGDFLGVPGFDGALEEYGSSRAGELLASGLLRMICDADETPAAIVFEDLQWSDAGTRRLLDSLALRVAEEPWLFVVCTTRDEASLATLIAQGARRLALGRLSMPETAEIVAAFGVVAAYPERLPELLASSGGIPLFAEELARFLMERPLPAEKADDQLLALPGSLVELITARLDNLQSGRATLRLCAVIGQETPLSLLEDLEPAWPLKADLAELERAGIVVVRATWPEPIYAFRHDMYRVVAYHTLTRQQRVRIHERVAEAMASRDQPDVRAKHLAAAGRHADAFQQFRLAYLRTSRRNLLDEAHALWLQATSAAETAALEDLPAADHFLDALQLGFVDILEWASIRKYAERALSIYERDRHTIGVIRAHLNLGASFASTRHAAQFDADQAQAHLDAARSAIDEIKSESLRVTVDVYQSNVSRAIGDHERERRASQSALEGAICSGRPPLISLASMTQSMTLFADGEFRKAFSIVDETLRRLRSALDPGSSGVAHMMIGALGTATLFAGRPRDLIEPIEGEMSLDRQSVPQCQELDFLLSLARYRLGQLKERPEITPEVEVAEPIPVALWKAWHADHEGAVAVLQRRLEQVESMNAPYMVATTQSGLAWVYVSVGEYELAKRTVAACAPSLAATQLYSAFASILGAIACSLTGESEQAVRYLAAIPVDSEVLDGGLEGWRRLALACHCATVFQAEEAESELASARRSFQDNGLVLDESIAERVFRDLAEAMSISSLKSL